jgi:hypothetical protein
MIPELAAQYAARASGAAISETSIKEITRVLNRRTQRSRRAILLSRPLLDPRTHDEIARVPAGKEKTALLSGTRFQCDAENSEPDGCEFMQATAARRLRAVPVA